MLIILLFSYIIIVPLSHGNVVKEQVRKTEMPPPVLNKIQQDEHIDQGQERKMNKSTPVPNKVKQDEHIKTKITIAGEGGAIMSNTPALSLPKENPAILMTADNGISSNKVKARKGATLYTEEDNDNENISEKHNKSINKGNENTRVTPSNIDVNNTKVFNLSNTLTNVTKAHKPTILSADGIAKADEMNNNPVLDEVKERKIKFDPLNSNGHPGMVMPIVITILVVPMFAVLGYMVLKRGQEAWKNRHYKRMDFLLDGMYND